MTVQLISFPFRLNKQGTVATADDTSAEYCAERLAIILGTRPGERVMNPDFGINDPAFEGFTETALRIQVARSGMPIDLGTIKRMYLDDAREQVTIQFDMTQSWYGGML